MSCCTMSPNTACWNLESAPAHEIQSFPGCTWLADIPVFRWCRSQRASDQLPLPTSFWCPASAAGARRGGTWAYVLCLCPTGLWWYQANAEHKLASALTQQVNPEEETREGKVKLTIFNIRKTCLSLSPCKIDDFYHLELLCVIFWAE